MTLRELCARNVSAGLREVLNAVNAVHAERTAEEVKPREIDDATADLLAQAAECLERASEKLAERRPKADPKPAKPEKPAAPAPAAAGTKK